MDVLSDPDQITPAVATAWLRDSGVLPEGEVTGVEVTGRRSTNISLTATVRLSYSPDARGGLPDSVFFKAAGMGSRASNAEVQFYRLVGPRIDHGPLVTCYASQYSSQRGAYYLVLEDVSESHVFHQQLDQVDWFRSEYSWGVAAQIVQGLALVHGLFWGDLQLGVTLGVEPEDDLLPKERDILDAFRRHDDALDGFLSEIDDRLSPENRELLRTVSKAYPELLLERLQSKANLTLTHGDTHTGNVLVPRDPAEASAVVIDWGSYRQWIGIHDVVDHFIPYWCRSARQAIETRLIRLYHHRLRELGVGHYSWEDCWDDYRLGVIGQVYWRCKSGLFDTPANLWTCDNCLSAFEDLECEQLLPSS